MGPTKALSSYVAGLTFETLPATAVDACKMHVLDTLGICLRGSRAAHMPPIVKVVGQIGGSQQCTVAGYSFRTSALEAAFLNAVMGHSIDFDDSHKFVHPGAAIVPAALSVGESLGVNGQRLIAAIVAGYEIAVRVSLAAGLRHRERGFHPTGTCNTFAAAAAAAHLLDCSPAQMESALGIACSEAAGVTQYRFSGSPNKHLHAGIAARGGILAAMLSQAGFSGPPDIFEGKFGFLNVMADGGEPEQLVKDLGSIPAIAQTDIKPYSCCRQTHTPIDLVLKAVREHAVKPADIEAVTLYTYEYANTSWLVSTEPPSNSLQAMLNFPYCLAVAFVDGQVSLDQFEDNRLHDQTVLGLARKITVKSDPGISARFPAEKAARLEVTLNDGRVLMLEANNPKGSVDSPLSFQDVVEKFNGLAVPVVGRRRSNSIIDLVTRLESVAKVGDLARLLAGAGRAKQRERNVRVGRPVIRVSSRMRLSAERNRQSTRLLPSRRWARKDTVRNAAQRTGGMSMFVSRVPPLSAFFQYLRGLIPGLCACFTVALAAQFLSEHYGAPAMLMALLFGIAFHFLAEEGKCVPGIGFAARTLLRLSVALLGTRISFDLIVSLGLPNVALVVAAVVATILFGLIFARFFGRGWRLGLITGGSVAICGASAALALAAVIPENKNAERNLTFTVMSVTILSTMAMIAYPIITTALGLDIRSAGLFLGATIHDVAQVVGAGFSISDQAGDTATVVKLIRVTMLAPVVLLLSLVFRTTHSDQVGRRNAPILPAFVAGFLVLSTLNSLHLIAQPIVDLAGGASRWGLLTAIAAVGMKTSLKDITSIGGTAVFLVVLETAFIGGFVLAGINILQ